MSFKTILVLIDTSAGNAARIDCACRLALTHDAHLVGVTQSGIHRLVYGSVDPRGNLGAVAPLFADLRAEAALRAERFEQMARQAGLASFEHRIVDDEAGYALASQSLYADLVIVGQTDPGNPDSAGAGAGIPEYVALHAPCPVLVLPYAGPPRAGFARVLVAWNASPESAQAVRQALPFLVRAAEVEVAVAGHAASAAAPGGPEIEAFLARHGVEARLWLAPGAAAANADAGDTLLSRVAELDADLLVMGCYGHTRLREVLLGGVSRTVLRSMTVPTLMAH